MIHFPADVKTRRSNCVNTERENGEKESCAMCAAVEANTHKKKINIGKKGKRWEEVVEGKEGKRLKAWQTRLGDDREGMVSQKTWS